MQKVIGIGNSLVDLLVKVGHDAALEAFNLPKGSMQLVGAADAARIGRQLQATDCTRAAGGSASNTLKALARLGAGAGFIGKVADDENGRFFATELQRAGVNTALSAVVGGQTGTASTFITPDGQRTFATHLGVAAELRPQDVTPEKLEGYDILYIEGYLVQNHELIEHAMELAKRRGMAVALDLASYNVVESECNFFDHLLRTYVDIVFANEEESYAFTQQVPEAAARTLGELCTVAVVKLGKAGASVYADGTYLVRPAETVAHVVDTTGAGDYFAAGFLYAYANGRPLADCLDAGSKMSAAVIQVIGTTVDTLPAL